MRLRKKTKSINFEVDLPASKSESNRVLIISKLAGITFDKINNLSLAQDTQTLRSILESETNIYDVGHAGTAMRFLTAYFAIDNKEIVLTGSSRMKKRPIKILVDALRSIGAEIVYQDKNGYPPLIIKGSVLNGSSVKLDTSISSQYLSALLMISPFLNNGLEIIEEGDTVSTPYIEMTIQIMNHFGVEVKRTKSGYYIPKQVYVSKEYTIESDWSAASYWYEIACLTPECKIQLNGLRQKSKQGDIALIQHFEKLGVITEWNDRGVLLIKNKDFYLNKDEILDFSLLETPDIAQTLICACAGLGVKANFRGLSTLKIKETDRLTALKAELAKVGVDLSISNDSASLLKITTLVNAVKPIMTYEDHRMAMSFAPLALILDDLNINNPNVVKKSYPDFWNDMEQLFDVIQ